MEIVKKDNNNSAPIRLAIMLVSATASKSQLTISSNSGSNFRSSLARLMIIWYGLYLKKNIIAWIYVHIMLWLYLVAHIHHYGWYLCLFALYDVYIYIYMYAHVCIDDFIISNSYCILINRSSLIINIRPFIMNPTSIWYPNIT